jgi:hypothetical protein
MADNVQLKAAPKAASSPIISLQSSQLLEKDDVRSELNAYRWENRFFLIHANRDKVFSAVRSGSELTHEQLGIQRLSLSGKVATGVV